MSRPTRMRLVLGVFALFGARAASGVGEPSPGSATASTLKLPDGPGSIRGLGGSAGANVFSGQVTYAVPIDLPSGIAGFGPSLGLTYSGALGNGPMGIGWDLPLPAIHRSTRRGVPHYTEEDELELSGVPGAGRLVTVGDGTYRVEGGGQAVRVLTETWGYTVVLASGMRYRMDRVQGAAGRPPNAWYASDARSVTADTLSFTYLESEGQVVLSRLAWGPQFACDLHYEARPDPVVSYREGFRVVTGRRLHRISVTSGSHELRAYTLTYDATADLPVSRLTEIRMTGLDGDGALPPVSFAYGTDLVPAVHEISGVGGWELGARGVTLADVDGDGLDDLVRYELGARSWRRNLVGHFASPLPLPGAELRPLDDVRLMDLTGDGHAEMAYVVGNTWRVYTLAAGAYVPLQTWPGSEGVALQDPDVAYADLNGDRRTDVLRARGGGLEVAFGGAEGLGAFEGKGPIAPADLVVGLGDDRLELQDANGDGLADALWRGTHRLYVYYGKGDGTFADGLPYEYPWSMPVQDPSALRLVDLNRDGLLDVLRVEAGHVYWWAGTARGFSQTMKGEAKRPATASYDDVVTVSDLDGDGAAEVVWSGPSGLWTLGLAGPASQAMLKAIDNGLGAVTTIQYSTSARMAREAEGAGWPWDRQLAAVIPVPWRMSVSPGGGEPPREVVYRVRDGFWDALEQSFGGFLGSITMTVGDTPAETLVVETEYEEGLGMSREMRGKPWRERARDDAGKLLSETFNTWDVAAIDGLSAIEPKLRMAVLREARVDTYEGAPDPISTLSSTEYDGEGQPVREEKFGRLDLTGDEAITERVYAHNDDTGVRGVVCAERMREADGTVVRYTRHQYDTLLPVDASCDADAAELCPCTVTKGHRRATDGWLGPYAEPGQATEPGRWIRLSEVDLDAYGNPTRKTEGGVARHVDYHGDHVHPVAEWLEPTPGFELRWTLDWDPALGLPTRLIDPNGDAGEVGYDSLGRVTEMRVPLGNPATLEPVLAVEYHLDTAAPGPHVTSHRLEHSQAPDGEVVSVVNGLGEPRYAATRVDDARWSVGGFQVRDRRGLVALAAKPFFWTGPTPPTALPEETATQSSTYDAQGRRVGSHLPATDSTPEGATASTSVAPFRTTEATSWELALPPPEPPRSESLAPVTHETDGLGRTIRTERDVDGVIETTSTRYNAAGQIREIRLQNGAVVHAFQYDTLGRLRHGYDPDIGHRYSRWNDAGQLVETENGVGDLLDYNYDGAGRVIVRHAVAASGPYDETFTFRYDHLGIDATPSPAELDDARASHQLGRLARVTEPFGTETVRYDAAGRAVFSERSIDGSTAVRHVSLSPSGLPLGDLVKIAGAERFRTANSYDTAGWLTELQAAREGQSLSALWTRTAFAPSGAVTHSQLGNGLGTQVDRDVLDQSTRLRLGPAEGAATYDVGLVRNGYGGIVRVTEPPAAPGSILRAAEYEYDGAARLVSASVGGYSFGYTYDALQNMTSRAIEGGSLTLPIPIGPYTYGGGNADASEGGTGPRQLTAAGGGVLQYDLAGRTARRGPDVLAFDAADRLRSVALSGSPVLTYRYGADGNQTERLVGGVVAERRFADDLVERDGRFELVVSVGGELVARLAVPNLPTSPLIGAEPIQYLHQGAGHGPSLVTGPDGTVLEERLYEPFGVLLASESATEASYGVEPYAWNGKPVDPVTGWSDHGARWNATELGRWLTPDPVVKGPVAMRAGAMADLNPYQFSGQNPIVFWDPNGRERVHDGTTEAADASYRFKYDLPLAQATSQGLLSYTLFAAHGGGLRVGNPISRGDAFAQYSPTYDDVIIYPDLMNRDGNSELRNHVAFFHELYHAERARDLYSVAPDSEEHADLRQAERKDSARRVSTAVFVEGYVSEEFDAEVSGIRLALSSCKQSGGFCGTSPGDHAYLKTLGLSGIEASIGSMSNDDLDRAALGGAINLFVNGRTEDGQPIGQAYEEKAIRYHGDAFR